MIKKKYLNLIGKQCNSNLATWQTKKQNNSQNWTNKDLLKNNEWIVDDGTLLLYAREIIIIHQIEIGMPKYK